MTSREKALIVYRFEKALETMEDAIFRKIMLHLGFPERNRSWSISEIL